MKKTTALLAVLLAAAPAVRAEEWVTMGPRAMGMGGAGVALAQGPLASYWNPAALGHATENSYGFSAPVDVHAALTGPVIAGANDLKNAQNACQANSLTCQGQVNAALGELSNPTNGLRVNGSAGGNFKIGKIGFFLNGFLDAGAVPRIDNTPADTTGAAIAAGNNKSALIVKGAQIDEFGAGYGHELPFASGLFVGGDVKLMRAKVGYASQQIIQSNSQNNNSSSNLVSDLKNGEASSGNIGFDAGALWQVNKTFENAWWNPRVGLTGRNLNNPKFTEPAAAAADGVGGRYSVNPQARLGLAISPFHWWNLAADLDMTNNITPVDGVKSRQLGLGSEFNVFNRSWINIPLRFGVARNTSAASNMLTAGTGLNFLHLMVDLSGEFSPNSVQTQTQGQSKKIPQELGAAFSLSLLFGGSEEDRGGSGPATNDQQPAPVPQFSTPPAPAAPSTAPAKPAASNSLTPAQADDVRAHADKAQQDLNKAATQPAPSGN